LALIVALTVVVALGVATDGSSDLALSASPPTFTDSPPAGWQLAFSSDFSGTALNPRVWGECYPWANASLGCTNFGNEEKEWYQESQISVRNGILDLIASPQLAVGYSQSGKPEQYECTSGMVTTFPGFDFTYGFVQVIARLPFGKDLWPAFWLGPQNGQWPPEIDILEHWDTQKTSQATLHPVRGPLQVAVAGTPDANKGWHTFSLSWTPTRVTWWYDGTQVLTTTKAVPRLAMFLILNLAVDEHGPGGCNGTLSIKSVKVWTPQWK